MRGFVSSQREGIEVFKNVPPDAPVVVAIANWQYSHHVLPGLRTPEEIEAVCRSVSRPVNVLALPGCPSAGFGTTAPCRRRPCCSGPDKATR